MSASVSERRQQLIEQLNAQFGDRVRVSEGVDMVTVELDPEHLLDVARSLRDEPAFGFEQLTDLCGIDYATFGRDEWDTDDVTREGFSRGAEGQGPGRFDWAQRPSFEQQRRFAVVTHLLSLRNNLRIRLRYFAPDDGVPVVPSLIEIWRGVDWFEREAFDLFGIVFEGHPDLRRLLTDYGFVGHPFRKDFPLVGNVEVRYDPERGRVVYQPVSIEPRVNVPRVIRDDSRYSLSRLEAAEANSSDSAGEAAEGND